MISVIKWPVSSLCKKPMEKIITCNFKWFNLDVRDSHEPRLIYYLRDSKSISSADTTQFS